MTSFDFVFKLPERISPRVFLYLGGSQSFFPPNSFFIIFTKKMDEINDVIDYTQFLPSEIMCLIAEFAECPLALELTSRRWREIVQSLRHKYPWTPKRSLGVTWDEANWNNPNIINNRTMRAVAAVWYGKYDELVTIPYLDTIWLTPKYQLFPSNLQVPSGMSMVDAIGIYAIMNGHFNLFELYKRDTFIKSRADFTFDRDLTIAAFIRADKRREAIDWLQQSYNIDVDVAIKVAAKQNDIDTVKYVIDLYPEEAGRDGWQRACRFAIKYGHTDFIRLVPPPYQPPLNVDELVYTDTTLWAANFWYNEQLDVLIDRDWDATVIALHAGNAALATRLIELGARMPRDEQLIDVLFLSYSIDTYRWIRNTRPNLVIRLNARARLSVKSKHQSFIEHLLNDNVILDPQHLVCYGCDLKFMKRVYSSKTLYTYSLDQSWYLSQYTDVLEWWLDENYTTVETLFDIFIGQGRIDGLAMLQRKGYYLSIDKFRTYARQPADKRVIYWALQQPNLPDSMFIELHYIMICVDYRGRYCCDLIRDSDRRLALPPMS